MRRLVLLLVLVISSWSMINAQKVIVDIDFEQYDIDAKPTFAAADYGLDILRAQNATYVVTDSVGSSKSLHLSYLSTKDGKNPSFNFQVSADSILDPAKGKDVYIEAYIRLIDSVEPIDLYMEQLVTFESGVKTRLRTTFVEESSTLIKYTSPIFYYNADSTLTKIQYNFRALKPVSIANNNNGFHYFIDSVKVIAVDHTPVAPSMGRVLPVNGIVYIDSTELIDFTKLNLADADNALSELTETFEGTDPTTLSFVTTYRNATTNLIDSLLFAPVAGDEGDFSFTYIVKDPGGLSDTAVFSRTIIDSRSPVVKDHNDIIAYTADTANFLFKVEDNDTEIDALTITLEGDDISSFSQISGTTLVVYPDETNIGEYNVIYKVSDGTFSDTTGFKLTVVSGAVPRVEGLPEDTTLNAGEVVKLPFTISDGDNTPDEITVTVEGPDFVTIVGDTLVIAPTTSDTSGIYVASVKATDPDKNESVVAVNIVVINEGGTGVVEQEVVELIIAPNPTNGQFYVNSNQMITGYTVFNTIGQVVSYNGMVNNNRVDVNITGENRGLYFVKVDFENGTSEVVKVIVK